MEFNSFQTFTTLRARLYSSWLLKGTSGSLDLEEEETSLSTIREPPELHTVFCIAEQSI